jgi:hypothetical protein
MINQSNTAYCAIDAEERHEPASDIDCVVVDSLKVLDPNRPASEEKRKCRDSAPNVNNDPKLALSELLHRLGIGLEGL